MLPRLPLQQHWSTCGTRCRSYWATSGCSRWATSGCSRWWWGWRCRCSGRTHSGLNGPIASAWHAVVIVLASLTLHKDAARGLVVALVVQRLRRCVAGISCDGLHWTTRCTALTRTGTAVGRREVLCDARHGKQENCACDADGDVKTGRAHPAQQERLL